MTFELILLSGLIFIFIISFCGLLQKIKQSYERERIIAERLANRNGDAHRATMDSVYMNSAYIADVNNGSGIFPEAPPPYIYVCPPPKYDEVIKDSTIPVPTNNTTAATQTTATSTPISSSPPAYTIITAV
nr:unnamed protein product [Callosobruchus chinensis]